MKAMAEELRALADVTQAARLALLPVPQVQEQTLEIVKMIPKQPISKRIVEQSVHAPVSRIVGKMR